MEIRNLSVDDGFEDGVIEIYMSGSYELLDKSEATLLMEHMRSVIEGEW